MLKRKHDWPSWKKLKVALILLVDGIVAVRSQTGMVNPDIAEMCRDLDFFINYPWGREGFYLTVDDIVPDKSDKSLLYTVARQKQQSLSIRGFPLAIQLLAYETISGLDPIRVEDDDMVDYTQRSTQNIMKKNCIKDIDIVALELDPTIHINSVIHTSSKMFIQHEDDPTIDDPKLCYVWEHLKAGDTFPIKVWPGGDYTCCRVLSPGERSKVKEYEAELERRSAKKDVEFLGEEVKRKRKRSSAEEERDEGIATPVRQKKAQGQTSNKKTLEPMRNRNESTREKMCEEHYSRKRKTREEDNTILVLPFTKKSSVWKIYESMEDFKRVPQTPHFNPLIETKEDFREGYALGMMATFPLLLEKLKDLKSDVPISQLESLKDSFSELEKHGFNITSPLSRIDNLLAMKNRQSILSEELKGFEKEKTDESSKMRKAEEEIYEIELKIFELRRQRVVQYKEKKSAYEKICQKESCARDVGVKLKDVESEFETTVSAPW